VPGGGVSLLRERGLDAPSLAELQQTILRREVPAAPVVVAGGTPVPRMLPTDPPGFVGRDDELAHARRVICGRAGGLRTLVVVGPAGVGKTSLAVRVGRSLLDRFPDGQLFVNLRGFHPVGTAMSAGEAVQVFLDALQVPAYRIPASLQGRSISIGACWRAGGC